MENKTEYIGKSGPNKKYKLRAGAVIAAVAAAVAVGTVLMIYNIMSGALIFAVAYMIAVILGCCYIVIEINSIFATYVAADRQNLYLKNWTNGFVPYELKNKIEFIREFIPSKTEIAQIKIKNIRRCLLGSGKFVKRYCRDNQTFIDRLDEFEKMPFVSKTTARRMVYFYIETGSGETYFMPVTGFDEDELIKILNLIERRGAEVKCNNYSMVKKRRALGGKY